VIFMRAMLFPFLCVLVPDAHSIQPLNGVMIS
jgi:hypothetical protein